MKNRLNKRCWGRGMCGRLLVAIILGFSSFFVSLEAVNNLTTSYNVAVCGTQNIDSDHGYLPNNVAAFIDGVLNFSNGSGSVALFLDDDVWFTSIMNRFTFTGPTESNNASINGSGHTIHLGGDFSLSAGAILINLSDLIIDGHNKTFSFGDYNATFTINATRSLTLRNMTIKGLGGAQACQIVGGGTLKLQNVIVDIPADTTWTFSGNATTAPALQIQDDVIFRGGGTFSYMSGRNLTINQYSTLYFDHNFTFSWDTRRPYGLSMTDATSSLYLNGSTLSVPIYGGGGLNLSKGMLLLDNKVTLNNYTNTTDEKAIVLGTGNTGEDLEVKVLSAARVDINGLVKHNPSAD